MNPINPADAPPGWHAVEPPPKFLVGGESMGGACLECGVNLEPNCSARPGCTGRCCPNSRLDKRFVHFRKGPATYGNEED